MKDWRQEISDVIREGCTHGRSSITGNGCIECRGIYLSVLEAIDEGLKDLAEQMISARDRDCVVHFKRSIPEG